MKEKKENWWLPDPSTWRGTWRDDWRIMGQEGYLTDKLLQHRKFDRKLCVLDFDQCNFCYEIFDRNPEAPLTAYYEPIGKYWICEECYNDFKEHFNWTVEELLESESASNEQSTITND